MSEGPRELTHVDAEGKAKMVDVSGKDVTSRKAVAEGAIRMAEETLTAIRTGQGPKGEVFQVARLAGIQAGKKTADLIPLCHALPGASVAVEVESDQDLPGVRVRATAIVAGQTGVEMEALTAASVALLTIYDMVKAMDRGMVLEEIRLVSKEGGRSGVWNVEGGG
jgi:cyclic pyranopterin phosphate synthase